MKNKSRIIRLLVPLFILGLAAMVLSQPGGHGPEGPGMNVLAPLEATLQAAGAPGLSAEQGKAILGLIARFRGPGRFPKTNMDVRIVREEYEKAILNSDLGTASAQAIIIANLQAAETASREAENAVFAIAVIAILKENPAQYEALLKKTEPQGLVKLICDLGSGPGRTRPDRGPGEPPNAIYFLLNEKSL